MKAVYINQAGGGLNSLVYGDRPEPEAGPGEVVLRVRASALNHADLNVLEGRTSTRGAPRVMGMDMAGEVVQVSPTVSWLKEGDRVLVDNRIKCGTCEPCLQGSDEYCVGQMRLGVDVDGGHAQYCVVPAVNAHQIPDWMGFDEAASLPIAAHTAWHCLVVRGQLQPWEDVLIHAVGSGVGSTGLEIAKHIGARVIATAGSDWKLEKAKELGADEVINYNTTPEFSERVREFTGGKGVDIIFDVVGAAVWDESLLSLKPGGRLVITGTTSGSRYDMDLRALQGTPLTLMGSGGRSRRSFADMMRVISNGGLRGVVGKTFPLEDAADAHKAMKDRNFFGKLVLQIP
jgi:NADPH:quinone reductase-like Zn-dependent oxidoreductase